MTRWIASDGCMIDVAMGTERARICPHGCAYVSEKRLQRSVGVDAGKESSGGTVLFAPSSGDATPPSVDSSAPHSSHQTQLRHRKPMRRSEPKRDWSLALAKVEEEDGCRICGARVEFLECAHILGRKFDRPISEGSKTLLVLPDRIVPLCNQLADGHHQSYDAHELDLLPYLTTAEQAQAVLDAGSIITALKRISPHLQDSYDRAEVVK